MSSYAVDDSRHYVNLFNDYSPSSSLSIITPTADAIDGRFKVKLSQNITKLLHKLERRKKHWDNNDFSIYTGKAGIAYMYYQYGNLFGEFDYINKAIELLRECLNSHSVKRRVTFLTGLVGPLALAAVVFHRHTDQKESHNLISKLRSLCDSVLTDSPDELLYGRAGYLFALLYINANILPPPIEDCIISKIVNCIIKSGKNYAASTHCESPLMYSWHDKEYLGGAHGLAGILYILLQSRKYLTQEQLDKEIRPALYYLQKLQFTSHNFLSSVGSESDRLVQWCHGAPGMTMLFCLAYEVFKDDQFLDTAVHCGEVVWSRGLLRKGYSLCHGVAGNAYSFLSLFQQIKDIKYLYRACKFAEWCVDDEVHLNRDPDRPFSLFEGLAGVLYFLCDLQQPQLAKFPGYTL